MAGGKAGERNAPRGGQPKAGGRSPAISPALPGSPQRGRQGRGVAGENKAKTDAAKEKDKERPPTKRRPGALSPSRALPGFAPGRETAVGLGGEQPTLQKDSTACGVAAWAGEAQTPKPPSARAALPLARPLRLVVGLAALGRPKAGTRPLNTAGVWAGPNSGWGLGRLAAVCDRGARQQGAKAKLGPCRCVSPGKSLPA